MNTATVTTTTTTIHYIPLYAAIVAGSRFKVTAFLQRDPQAIRVPITDRSETPVHVAAGPTAAKAACIVPLLVNMIPRDEVASLVDEEGNTVLMVAAGAGIVSVAAMLVERDNTRRLLWTPNTAEETPLLKAAQYGNKRMVRYLLCFLEEQRDRLSEVSRVRFVELLLIAGFHDLALYVIERTQMLAIQNVAQPNPSIPQCYESFLEVIARTPAPSSFRAKLCYVQVIKSICNRISTSEEFTMFKNPLLLAAELGVQEIIEEIIKVYPDAIWFSNDDGHNIYHLSVIHRHENIFGLLRLMRGCKNSAMGARDNANNNILHLVAALTPSNKLNSVCGPALRMQYELKWYKEVQKHVQPADIIEKNNNEKTPSMIFTEEHEILVKAGEKWMKGAATAGSLAATLIATVVFAAAINVPGGSKDNDGSPNYIMSKNYSTIFHVFLYADGLSLFLSISSVLMFMSILASGFAESDFSNVLANRLIFGLLTLLFSLTSMLVAFWASFLLATQSQLESTAGFALLQLTYIPGFLFMCLLYPLLSQMIRLTWSPTIFHPRSKSFWHEICILLSLLCWKEHLHISIVRSLCNLEVQVIQVKEFLLRLVYVCTSFTKSS